VAVTVVPSGDDEHMEVAVAAAIDEPEAPVETVAVTLDLQGVADAWPAMLDALKADSPVLAGALSKCKPVSVADDTITLAWAASDAFHKKRAEQPINGQLVGEKLRELTGASLALAHEVTDDATTQQQLMDPDHFVQRLQDEFDAQEL
jgi:hypothetical protein